MQYPYRDGMGHCFHKCSTWWHKQKIFGRIRICLCTLYLIKDYNKYLIVTHTYLNDTIWSSVRVPNLDQLCHESSSAESKEYKYAYYTCVELLLHKTANRRCTNTHTQHLHSYSQAINCYSRVNRVN
jgi:hypothetical protein